MRGEAGERKGKRKDERGGSRGMRLREDEWGGRGEDEGWEGREAREMVKVG
jgi:hypothetical protein